MSIPIGKEIKRQKSDDLICVVGTVELAVEEVCLIVQSLRSSDQLIVLYNPTILASLTIQ